MIARAIRCSDLRAIWPEYQFTPLVQCPKLAARAGVGDVFVKLEGARPLGNFKALGGMVGALSLLAELTGHLSISGFLEAAPVRGLPTLICASDGNHGLAVAAAAQRAGTLADIFLPHGVDPARIARIAAMGTRPIVVPGTYDEAVELASMRASAGGGLLVADTAGALDDPGVAAVMAGYATLTDEISDQLASQAAGITHSFIQAGVGGLAAALTYLPSFARQPKPRMVVVEPETAACVAAGLQACRTVRIAGQLDSHAAMLSCGEASMPALARLIEIGAAAIQVSECALLNAVGIAETDLGLATTASGAAGLAGLLRAATDPDVRSQFALDRKSRILLIVTEGALAQHRGHAGAPC